MGEYLHGIDSIIFDLDDTLYNKCEWTVQALEFAAAKMGLDPHRVWVVSTSYIQQHGSADAGIYNHVLMECGQSDAAYNIRALAAWANQYEPTSSSLSLLPGVQEALQALDRRYRLAVIADGPVACQQAKVRALLLDRLIRTVIYSDAIDGVRSRRPDPRVFQLALRELGTPAAQTLFVGDNPLRDFLEPRAMGITTVRVMSGEYAGYDYPSPEHAADYQITSVARLPQLLADSPQPLATPAGAKWKNELSVRPSTSAA